jgi:hypothetical protein
MPDKKVSAGFCARILAYDEYTLLLVAGAVSFAHG